jgi:Domain of unknown function (DUF4303)
MIPTEAELADAIEAATRSAVRLLVETHPEQFYYFTLTTTGEAHCPVFSAWSKEALEAATTHEPDPEKAKYFLKWSYADSPYCFFGEQFFEPVRKLFDRRPQMSCDMTDEQRVNEYATRLKAMETALMRLDAAGVFATNRDRSLVFINVEVVPPDYSNTERAIRFNPPFALQEWLVEMAEPET